MPYNKAIKNPLIVPLLVDDPHVENEYYPLDPEKYSRGSKSCCLVAIQVRPSWVGIIPNMVSWAI